MNAFTPTRLRNLILALYLLITLAYGAINPLFEAPDEHHHYFTAHYIAETRQLPYVDQVPADDLMAQEAAQPPLYYILSALLIAPFDIDQAEEELWFNPRVQLGDASSPTNTNAFVHPPSEEWPWRGHVLAAHLLRAFSALLGLFTLLAVYGSARLVWPEDDEPPLVALAIVAFLPQFNFLHSAVSNDPLVICFASLTLYQLLRAWGDGLSRRRALLLGLTIGLAMLSKMAGLLLLLYTLGFLIVLALRDSYRATEPPASPDFKHLATTWLPPLAITAAVALLLGGWLLVRNWLLYEDITATSQFIAIAGGDREFTLWEVLNETGGLWASLFSIFGWMNVRPPQVIFTLWNSFVSLAVGGAVLGLWLSPVRRRGVPRSLRGWLEHPWLPYGLLASWLGLVYIGLVQFMLKTPAAQGRLLLPAVVPLALAFTYGLTHLRQRWLNILVSVLALLSTLYALLFVIPAAYAPPPLLVEGEVPETAVPLQVDFGQGLHLLAAEVETEVTQPGGWIWLNLYWQTEPAINDLALQEAPEYVLELLGRDDQVVGKLQSYHGGGLYPATLWPTGVPVADRLAVRVEEEAQVPVLVRLNLKLAEREGDVAVDVGAVKVAPTNWPEPAGEPLAEWPGLALLEAALVESEVRAGETAVIHLRWHVTESINEQLTTFVHLGQPDQQPLAQGDRPPLAGHYPTNLWAAGELFDDQYQLLIPATLEPGAYSIQIGLYDPATGMRRPLFIDGQRQPHDAFRLTVQVR